MNYFKNIFPTVVTCVIGITLTVLFTLFLNGKKEQLAISEFQRNASDLSTRLRDKIADTTQALYHLSSFYNSSNEVTREEFDRYISGFVDQYPEIQAWEWAPRISQKMRAVHEKNQSKFRAGYTITEKHNDSLRSAQKRDFYYPVSFIYPAQGNENAFGYDLASDTIRKSMIHEAIRNNTMTISKRIHLVQEKQRSYAVLVAIPIYTPNTHTAIQSLDSYLVKGIVLAVIRINDMIRDIAYSESAFPFGISVSETLGNEELHLYTSGRFSDKNHLHDAQVRVANQVWRIRLSANLSSFGSSHQYDIVVSLFIGLLFTFMITVYIHIMRINHRQSINAYHRLNAEIETRKKYEEKLVESNQMLETLSRVDPVMKIANRHAFNEYLTSELLRAKRSGFPVSLLIADIDNFKAYNDKYGHVVGDHCLKLVAEVFSAYANRPADMPARYGGEEIAVILPETFQEGAIKVAEKIRMGVWRLSIPHEDSAVDSVVTISIGVTTFTKVNEHDPEAIIKVADSALYKAKQSGKNNVVYFKQDTIIASTNIGSISPIPLKPKSR